MIRYLRDCSYGLLFRCAVVLVIGLLFVSGGESLYARGSSVFNELDEVAFYANPGQGGQSMEEITTKIDWSAVDYTLSMPKMTIKEGGTLLVNNFTIGTNSELVIEPGGTLIIYGDLVTHNKMTISTGGTLIVFGNFDYKGTDKFGEFVAENPSEVYILGEIDGDHGFPVLSCDTLDPLDNYPNSNCNYGQEADLVYNPDYQNLCGQGHSGGSIAGDQDICSGGVIDGFTNVTAASEAINSYQWYYTTRADSPPVDSLRNWHIISGATSLDYVYNLGILTETTKFVRQGLIGQGCVVYSNVVTVMVREDTEAPVISGCPSDITEGYCNRAVTWTDPTATDVCDGAVTYTSRSHNPGDLFSVGTTVVNYVFTDASGKSSTCSFNVTIQPDISITLQGTTSLNCFGESSDITITASGGDGNYSYSEDGTNFVASNIFALYVGTHTLYVKDGSGCVKSKEITIEGPSKLTVDFSVSGAEICDGSVITLNATATGGSGVYNYSFLSDPGNVVVYDGADDHCSSSGLNTGDKVWVKVTDANGCEVKNPDSQDVVVTVKTVPQPQGIYHD